MVRSLIRLALLLALALPGALTAQVEIEADPFAWALNGFSLHAAVVQGPVRVSVGVFGIDEPASLHGNDGWRSTMRGAGVKIDYLGSRLDGLFVGGESGYMRSTYTVESSGLSEVRSVIGLGMRGGYRLSVGGSGLYVAPWVGASYNLDGDDVAIGGERFERSPVRVFPTVHIGWRF
jgi:hypothetical protein